MWKAQYTAITTADLSPVPLNDSDNELELSLLGYTTKPKGDELEEFVSSPTVLEMPLVFWKKNYESYLQLAKMAQDFFAIPASSAPSERCSQKLTLFCLIQEIALVPTKSKNRCCLIHGMTISVARIEH